MVPAADSDIFAHLALIKLIEKDWSWQNNRRERGRRMRSNSATYYFLFSFCSVLGQCVTHRGGIGGGGMDGFPFFSTTANY